MSKAVVLQKSIDFIQHLANQKKKQESELSSLRKEVGRGCYKTEFSLSSSFQVVALQIMRANYEQLVKAHQRAPQVQEDLVPDEVKFQVGSSMKNCFSSDP